MFDKQQFSHNSLTGLKERIEDYEATQKVYFPIKKLLILQPKSLFIPPKLESEHLEIARVSITSKRM